MWAHMAEDPVIANAKANLTRLEMFSMFVDPVTRTFKNADTGYIPIEHLQCT